MIHSRGFHKCKALLDVLEHKLMPVTHAVGYALQCHSHSWLISCSLQFLKYSHTTPMVPRVADAPTAQNAALDQRSVSSAHHAETSSQPLENALQEGSSDQQA